MSEVDRLRVVYELNDAQARAGFERMANTARATNAQLMAGAERVERSSGRLNGAIQNTAFQMQDLAVQISAGTSASVALGQPLPQLLGGFGALGAVIGAVVAVGVPLSAMFLGLNTQSRDLSDTLSELEKAIAALERAQNEASASAGDLVESYGRAAAAAAGFLSALSEIAEFDAIDKIDKAVENLDSSFASLFDGLVGASLSEQLGALDFDALAEFQAQAENAGRYGSEAIGRIANELDVSAQTATELARRLNDVMNAEGPLAQAQAAQQLQHYIEETLGSYGDLNAEQRIFYREIVSIGNQAGLLSGQIDDASDAMAAAQRAASGVAAAVAGIDMSGAIAQANELAGALSRGMAAIASLESRQSQAVARARIALDFAGDKVGAAGANAELDFNEAYGSGNRTMGPLLKADQDAIDARKAAFIEGQKAIVKTEEETQARLKKLAEASKPAGGGRKGGGGRATKADEPVNIFENAEREIVNLERQISVIGKSSEEVAKLQAQWAMLDAAKKAGIPVNDELTTKITAQAETVGQLTGQLERAELEQQQFDQAVEGIANAFSNAILEGENLRDSLAGIFKQIAANILNAGIQQAIAQVLSSAGGGGGFLSTILGAAFGGTKGAVDSYDGGGYTWDGPRSGGLDGKGGRLAMLHPNETVLDHTRGQGRAVSFSPSTTINVQGSMDDRTMAQLRRELDMRDQRLAGQVPSIMADHQKRRG